MADDLDLYRQEVVDAALKARSGKSEVIFNRSSAHASVLIAELINHAEKEVSILTGRLDPKVFDTPEVLSSLEKFSRQAGAKVNVILDGRDSVSGQIVADPVESKFISKVTTSSAESRIVHNLPEEVIKKYRCHFLVVDKRAYRFEPDWRDTEAIGSFLDNAFGTKLNDFFESLVASSNTKTPV